jgi:hypothetical protein
MITTPRDYYNLYHRIQSENAPSLAILLPTDEKIYNVDLNSRVVETPEYLGVERDHRAEVIYFKVNRFYDFYDLTQAVCVIQYINALGESRAYIVPYYDIDTLSGHDNTQGEQDDIILFPWIIDQETTKVRGPIQFNIKFYKLTDNGSRYLYNLTTLTAESQILAGIYDNSVTDLVELGYISEETFNAYRAANIPLYLKENDSELYYEAEIYVLERVYYINQEETYLATLKDNIYQKIQDIKDFDLYWEES